MVIDSTKGHSFIVDQTGRWNTKDPQQDSAVGKEKYS